MRYPWLLLIERKLWFSHNLPVHQHNFVFECHEDLRTGGRLFKMIDLMQYGNDSAERQPLYTAKARYKQRILLLSKYQTFNICDSRTQSTIQHSHLYVSSEVARPYWLRDWGLRSRSQDKQCGKKANCDSCEDPGRRPRHRPDCITSESHRCRH